MAVMRKVNGQYEVKSLKQAKEALRASLRLRDEIQALMEEHGITEMMEDAAELKKAATRYAVEKDRERIDLDGGVYAQLRRDKYGGTWVATEDDLDGAPDGAVPLLFVLRKKFKKLSVRKEIWNRITRRVVDQEALEAVIKEGVLDVDDVAPSYFEKEKSAYLRIYE